MKYINDEQNFPFLASLKSNYQIIRNEFINFCEDDKINLENFVQRTSAQKVINDVNYWKALAFYLHFKRPLQIIKENKRSFLHININAVSRKISYVYQHFPATLNLIDELFNDENNGIINAWFSYFEPGAKLSLHINDDPYMYRAHMGLIVPAGDIGFKVCDEVVKWKEGEILVFAPTNPHTAWNLTDKPRVLLIVDFFKPENNREEMKRLEREQFARIMKENPQSFGMSGGYSELNKETIEKYAVAGIW